MKNGIIMVMAFMFMGLTGVVAQGNAKKNGGKKLEEKKTFLTEKLSLTESEKEKLWPLMEERRTELKANKTAFKAAKPSKDKKIDDMSDADVEKMLNAGFDMKAKDTEIRKAYNARFISVIGVKRTAKLYHMERAFKKKKTVNSEGRGPRD